MKIVIDSSIFIDHLRASTGQDALEKLLHRTRKQIDDEYLVPTPVIYELWSGESMTKVGNCSRVELLLSQCNIIDLTDDIAKKAGELRRLDLTHGIDAMIAATTLLKADCLATLNLKHFKNIPNLELWEA